MAHRNTAQRPVPASPAKHEKRVNAASARVSALGQVTLCEGVTAHGQLLLIQGESLSECTQQLTAGHLYVVAEGSVQIVIPDILYDGDHAAKFSGGTKMKKLDPREATAVVVMPGEYFGELELPYRGRDGVSVAFRAKVLKQTAKLTLYEVAGEELDAVLDDPVFLRSIITTIHGRYARLADLLQILRIANTSARGKLAKPRGEYAKDPHLANFWKKNEASKFLKARVSAVLMYLFAGKIACIAQTGDHECIFAFPEGPIAHFLVRESYLAYLCGFTDFEDVAQTGKGVLVDTRDNGNVHKGRDDDSLFKPELDPHYGFKLLAWKKETTRDELHFRIKSKYGEQALSPLAPEDVISYGFRRFSEEQLSFLVQENPFHGNSNLISAERLNKLGSEGDDYVEVLLTEPFRLEKDAQIVAPQLTWQSLGIDVAKKVPSVVEASSTASFQTSSQVVDHPA